MSEHTGVLPHGSIATSSHSPSNTQPAAMRSSGVGWLTVATVVNGFGVAVEVALLQQFKVTRRRQWKRVSVERTYEYMTRVE